MDPVAVVTIRLLNNGSVDFNVQGPAANLLNLLGMLEMAKTAFQSQAGKAPPPIVGVPDGQIPNLRG